MRSSSPTTRWESHVHDRPAGRAAGPGRRLTQTCAPNRAKTAAIRGALAAIRMSGLTNSRYLAAVASRVTACTSRPERLSTSIGMSHMSRTTLRAVAPPRAGQMAPTRHTIRSRGSAIGRQPPLMSPDPSRAPRVGVAHGRPADPRRIPGSMTSESGEKNERQRSDRISRGKANTSVSWAVVTGCTTS